MGFKLSTGKHNFSIPFFMFDIGNKQLILSKPVPGAITDVKQIKLGETAVPGLNYEPIQYGGGGNNKIGFTIPVIARNNTVGNTLLIKQYENLRNQEVGLLNIARPGQFAPNPKVLFFWGTGKIPLIYRVSKCDFSHKELFVNQLGFPQWTDVEMELIVDETEPIYRAEELWRKFASLAGMVVNAYNVIDSFVNDSKPY